MRRKERRGFFNKKNKEEKRVDTIQLSADFKYCKTVSVATEKLTGPSGSSNQC